MITDLRFHNYFLPVIRVQLSDLFQWLLQFHCSSLSTCATPDAADIVDDVGVRGNFLLPRRCTLHVLTF